MAVGSKRVINGTHGTVYLDGDEIFEAISFQAKIEFQKEEVKVVGQMYTDSKIVGYSGKGSIALNKVNSRMLIKLSDEIKKGKDPRFVIIGKLADPDAWGSERIALYECSFDDLTLFDFEAGTNGKTECPFTFTKWDVLDKIV